MSDKILYFINIAIILSIYWLLPSTDIELSTLI